MDMLVSLWQNGGPVLVIIAGAVYIGKEWIKTTSKMQDHILSEWTEKQNRIHEDLHERIDDVQDDNTTNTMILAGIQEQLTGVILRAYRVDRRADVDKESSNEWKEACEQMERHNKSTERVVAHLASLQEERKTRAQTRRNT